MKGIADIINMYAQKRGITKSQATTEVNAFIDVLAECLIKHTGVSIRNLFSINKCVKKGRSGSFNGKDWSTEDSMTFKFRPSKYILDSANEE